MSIEVKDVAIIHSQFKNSHIVVSLLDSNNNRLGYSGSADALTATSHLFSEIKDALLKLFEQLEKQNVILNCIEDNGNKIKCPDNDNVLISKAQKRCFYINIHELDMYIQNHKNYGNEKIIADFYHSLCSIDAVSKIEEIITCIENDKSSAQVLQNAQAQIDISLKQIVALGVPQGNLNNLPQGTETAFLWASQGRLVLNVIRKIGGATDCLTLFCQNQKTGDRAAKFGSQDGKYALTLKLETMRQWFWCDTHLTGNPQSVYSNIIARAGNGVEMRTFFKPFEISSVSRGAANAAFIWRTYNKLPWDSGKDPTQDPSRLEIISQAREQWVNLIKATGNPEKFGLVNGAAK